jgi:hypothetical protein
MAAGLEGAAVIATDAVMVATSIIKISVFGLAESSPRRCWPLRSGRSRYPARSWRAFVERMPVRIHTAILDVAVIAGGLVMISAALRSLFS